MRDTVALLVGLFVMIAWLGGVVLAKGFWLTTLAVTVPFYAWYLVLERVMVMMGISI